MEFFFQISKRNNFSISMKKVGRIKGFSMASLSNKMDQAQFWVMFDLKPSLLNSHRQIDILPVGMKCLIKAPSLCKNSFRHQKACPRGIKVSMQGKFAEVCGIL